MSTRVRIWLAATLALLLLGGALTYGLVAWAGYQQRSSAPSEVQTKTDAPATGPHIIFRNTASGMGYGLVASVPLADPSGPRTVTTVACDRVYATRTMGMCLHIDRGVVTTFTASLMDANWSETQSWPLPGIPSRTRISADSRLITSTAFVTGESYATVGFSTQTVIRSLDGYDSGNLQDFPLLVDGQPVTAIDRNVWGVTFSADDNVFYATAASGGRTWLVRGDRAARTLTAIQDTAECPSLSPDGTQIAYKKNQATVTSPHWAIAVLTLATGVETVLPEKANVDDQVEWLDSHTLLYGLASPTTIGDSTVWSVLADGTRAPRPYIEHAWSPSVVR
ncbi:hypothetical protein AB4Y63_15565 [Leifsonia sp. YAF41]|uniref:hypothetical protein n=1 Tax=Leifsonia sp. YAF41 TaxID=3233086 RepID=UPI003F970890